MSDKKSPGCIIFAFISIIVFTLCITLIVLGVRGIISIELGSFGAVILFMIWLFVSTNIGKKQQAKLPVIEAQAVLIEKIQEDRRHSSNYFLTFQLDDESKKNVIC